MVVEIVLTLVAVLLLLGGWLLARRTPEEPKDPIYDTPSARMRQWADDVSSLP